MTAVMSELIPQFERASSHKVTVEYATVGVIAAHVLKGDAADVAIVSKGQSAELQKQGRSSFGISRRSSRSANRSYPMRGRSSPIGYGQRN